MKKSQLKRRVMTLISKIQEMQDACHAANLPMPSGEENFKQACVHFIMEIDSK